MKTEIRTLSTSLRAAPNSDFEIAGIAAAYRQLSLDLGGFKEIIMPGAFARALRGGTNVKMLYSHDPASVLGSEKSGTLKIFDSDEGLRFRCKLDPTSPLHQTAYAAIKRGDVDSCSFGFTVPSGGDSFEEATDEKTGKKFSLRRLLNVDVAEISAVSWPAYPEGTNVSARKFDYALSYSSDSEWAAIRARVDALGRDVANDRKAADEEKELRARVQRQKEEIFKSAPGFVQIVDERGEIDFRPMTESELTVHLRRI